MPTQFHETTESLRPAIKEWKENSTARMVSTSEGKSNKWLMLKSGVWIDEKGNKVS